MAKLLLVDDTPEIWDFLSRRLKRREHEVVLAHDGQAGLDMARAEQPQVILLDMNLPVMDGWTVARRLKDDPATAAMMPQPRTLTCSNRPGNLDTQGARP